MKQTLVAMTLPRLTEQTCTDKSGPTVTVSFDTVYERNVVFVWRTLRAFGVRSDALEDAVQDVFVIVHRDLATFDGRAKITTWLFAIARRVASNYRRVRVSSEEPPVIDERLRDPNPTPFEEASFTETKVILERILDLLDEKQRICFTLMEFEQMTAEEVASLLGVNVNTVYTRARRARLEFDRLVERYGIDL